jgi:hypothetical protein
MVIRISTDPELSTSSLASGETGGPGAAYRPAAPCVIWDETMENPATAFLAANLLPPQFPTWASSAA